MAKHEGPPQLEEAAIEQGKFQTLPLKDIEKAQNLAAYLTTGPLPLEIIYKPEAPSGISPDWNK